MAVAAKLDLTGARWSSAVHCPRRAVYDHQDAPKAEATDQQRRWWRRGHAIEDAIAGDIVQDLRDQGRRPRRQEPVAWPAGDPIGEAHPDIYIPHEQECIEVKSRCGCTLDAAAAVQVAGATLNHPRATSAQVVSVDPYSLEEKWYPIDVAGLEPRIREIEDQVVHGCKTGELPSRVCTHPFDSPAFQCPYVGVCFDGWQRPDPDVLLLDEEAVVLAELTDDVARAKRALEEAELAMKEQRATLRPYLEPGVEVETASIAKLKVIEVAGRRSLSLSDMENAGHQLPDELAAFVSESKPHERWQVKRREASR
jgi:hypothetical protein